MSGYGSASVEENRERDVQMLKERLAQGQPAETSICRVERVEGDPTTVRFGLKRGKIVYLFRYPTHHIVREKQRNVITRARLIKSALEQEGYRLIPWDFKKNQPPRFWEEGTMEEEDDDLYGPPDTAPAEQKQPAPKQKEEDDNGDQPMDEGLESGEEEDDESDSDVEFVLDKPEPKPVMYEHEALTERPKTDLTSVTTTEQGSKAVKIEAPAQQQASGKAAASTGTSAAPQQLGTSYPPVRTSSIDVNQDPIYPPVGKPVSQIDIDADLAESTKPWRLPGADQSDYFNYGFDEFTWEMYRQRQANMAQTLATQKVETAQFQQMFSAIGGPPMPGMPQAPAGPASGSVVAPAAPNAGVPGAPSGPSGQQAGGAPDVMGMPNLTIDQMLPYMQQMQAQGINPENMDFSQFMNMFNNAQQGGQQGFSGGGFGGSGGGQFGGGGGSSAGRGGGRGGRRW